MGCRGQVLTRGRAPQDGRTPLWVAVCNAHGAVVRALVEAGADMHVRSAKVGRTNCIDLCLCWVLSFSKAVDFRRTDEGCRNLQYSLDGNRVD